MSTDSNYGGFESRESRVVAEILGDVEAYTESDGPNGPWTFKTTQVRRHKNTIVVRDVDGRRCDRFSVDALAPKRDGGSHADMLRGRLERLNEQTLDEL